MFKTFYIYTIAYKNIYIGHSSGFPFHLYNNMVGSFELDMQISR